jgi:matrixin
VSAASRKPRKAIRGGPLAFGIATCVAIALVAPREARAYAFLYVGDSGGVRRAWDLANLPDGRVPWRLSSRLNGNVRGTRTVLDVLQASFAAWEDEGTTAIRFAFAGTTGTRNRDAGDGVNLITLGSDEKLGTGVLAVTFVASTPDGRLTDADIVFSRDVDLSTNDALDGTSYDVQSIATHEIGHLIGLEHSGLARATMAPFADRSDDHDRTPMSDDRIGPALLYPAGDFLARSGSIEGVVSLQGQAVFAAHVVATNLEGQVIAGAFSTPDGSYRIDGLPPDVYVVFAERLDGPIRAANVGGFIGGYGGSETVGYATAFH